MKQWKDLSGKNREKAIAHVKGRMLQGMCSGTPLANQEIDILVREILAKVTQSNEVWMGAYKLMQNEQIVAYLDQMAVKEAKKAYYPEGSELVLYIL